MVRHSWRYLRILKLIALLVNHQWTIVRFKARIRSLLRNGLISRQAGYLVVNIIVEYNLLKNRLIFIENIMLQ